MKLFLAVALLPAWIEAKLQINIEKQLCLGICNLQVFCKEKLGQ
jgi:hypothetical protein